MARQLSWPTVMLCIAVGAAWLVPALDWSFGPARILVAAGAASVVATLSLCVGWAAEPEEIERWLLRAAGAACAAAWPAFSPVA